MSKTATVTLPSRQNLPDGTPNPEYDPTLDPGSNLWMSEKYFDLEEKWLLHIGYDHENPHLVTIGASINGCRKEWPANSDQLVPVDFAEILIEKRLAYRIS